MKRLTAWILVLTLVLAFCTGCGKENTPDATDPPQPSVPKTPVDTPSEAPAKDTYLGDTQLGQFTIVYDGDSLDYTQRAAEYIANQVLARTGIILPICEADTGTYDHEILVGETDRALSQALEAPSGTLEFALMADENHIALEGEWFVIAAAAYYFVETYIPGDEFCSELPMEATVCQPITQEARNVIFMIGDGMGPVQTQLFADLTPSADVPYFDGEDFFYGYLLPYQGVIHTDSLSGLTDSAAASTALACGYKTLNSHAGTDAEGNQLQSLTELAAEKGKATGIMSTDKLVGATPAGFTAHVEDRDDTSAVSRSQQRLMKQYGTVLDCGLHGTKDYQTHITDMLARLEGDEDGFFLMYEEGHIDKASHAYDLQATFDCMIRFNQAIGVCMEYAFYHPDTLVLITADHETGGLTPDGTGHYAYTAEAHTNVDVPIMAYGRGAEAYDHYDQQNNEVPKVIAKLWGEENFGDNAQ